MDEIIVFAGILSALTLGIVQVVKQADVIPKNYIPVVSIVIGAALGGLTEFVPELLNEMSLGGRVTAGIISGLMATGVWETFKNRNGGVE